MKIEKITGVKVVVEFPFRVWYGLYPKNPIKAELNAADTAISDAEHFIRFIEDHRSQDGNVGELVKETETVCSFCGRDPEEDEGGPCCCNAAIEEWEETKRQKYEDAHAPKVKV